MPAAPVLTADRPRSRPATRLRVAALAALGVLALAVPLGTAAPAGASPARPALVAGSAPSSPQASSPAPGIAGSLPTLPDLAISRSVVNGVVVAKPSRSLPWVLPLVMVPTNRSDSLELCTASAISSRELLTAAHCVRDAGAYYVLKGANAYDFSRKPFSRGTVIPIESIRYNSRYSELLINDDVAVIRTVVPMNLRSYASVGTPSLARTARTNSALRFSLYGWGRYSDSVNAPDGHLRAGTVRQLNSVARAAFGRGFDPSRQLGAGTPLRTGRYVSSCRGDSGGPLVQQVKGVSYVVGVTSFGSDRGCSVTPTVFTSVGAYSSWIRSARAALPKLAAARSRAVPLVLSPPSIGTGEGEAVLALNSPLTCRTGTYTAGAAVAVAWYRGTTPVATGPAYALQTADAGQQLTCQVTASYPGSHVTTTAKVSVPAAPVANGSATVSSPDPAAAFGTGVVSCTAPSFSAGATVTSYQWFATPDRNPAGLVGTTPSLTLTPDVLARIGAGGTLTCVVTATAALGSAEATAGLVIPAPSLSVQLSSFSAPLPRGTVISCFPGAGSRVGPTTTYRWADLAAPGSASGGFPAGVPAIAGQTATTYKTTAPDANRYPACEVTTSSWAWQVSSYASVGQKAL